MNLPRTLMLSTWLALSLATSVSPAQAVAPARSAATARLPGPNGPSRLDTYALRLRPGEDLKLALQAFARTHALQAGHVITCVGSLREARLRFADQPEATALAGKFEIVSLVGTLTAKGAHLHLAIADAQGRTYGGHLVDGCQVYTTAELVIGELRDLTFQRAPDPVTTYQELEIAPRLAP